MFCYNKCALTLMAMAITSWNEKEKRSAAMIPVVNIAALIVEVGEGWCGRYFFLFKRMVLELKLRGVCLVYQLSKVSRHIYTGDLI